MWSRIDGSMFTVEVGRVELDLGRPSSPAATATTSSQPLAQLDALRPDVNRLRVEARQVEQLLDE